MTYLMRLNQFTAGAVLVLAVINVAAFVERGLTSGLVFSLAFDASAVGVGLMAVGAFRWMERVTR